MLRLTESASANRRSAGRRAPGGTSPRTIAPRIVLFDWALPGGTRPKPRVFAGLLLGLAGVGLLTGVSGAERIDPVGAAALLLASASFAAGSLLTRHVPHPESGLLTSALQMLMGGGLLLVVGSALGEWNRFPQGAPTPRGLLAVAFLAVFGSLLGFTLYAWLVRTAPPALVSTYPCVNPVVAVFLGAIFLREPLTPRTLVATAVIAASVGLIVSARSAPRSSIERRGDGTEAPEPFRTSDRASIRST